MFNHRTCSDVRLGGSSNTNEGYVEVQVNAEGWKGICDDGFDMNDANVICRSAGYPDGASAIFTQSKPFGYGSSGDDFALSNLQCTGTETRITKCPHNSMNLDCDLHEWAGVRCKGERQFQDCTSLSTN